MSRILSVWVDNKPGVLARIAGLIARRGFNIAFPIIMGQNTAGVLDGLVGVRDYGVDGSSHVVSPEKGKAPDISEGLPLAS